MTFRKAAAFVLTLLLPLWLCACDDVMPPQTDPPQQIQTTPAGTEPPVQVPVDISTLWTQGESPVPADRTGIRRQGIHTLSTYAFTDTGTYFLTQKNSYLIYADHGSDTFIKVCGRPDCPHNNSACDALFTGASSLQYYNGHLYIGDHLGVIRINLDGTDRVRVFSYSEIGAYDGLSAPEIWNGLLTFSVESVDSSGKEVYTSYRYNLDGSMDKPVQCKPPLPTFNHNGKFYGYISDEEGNLQYALWDPETDTTTYVCDFFESGIYCTETFSVVLQGSTVCCHTHADKNFTPLFDTGLEGELFLHCFPDCIVVSQKLDEKYSLHFYDWTYASLGSVKIEQEVTLWGQMCIICGETEEHIMISVSSIAMPEYYIEKSEFGTEGIALHKYELPDLGWEYVQP